MSQPASATVTLPSINIKELVVAIVHALNAVGVKVDEDSGVLIQEGLRDHVRAKHAETTGKDEVESSLKVTETSQASQAHTELEEEFKEYRVKEFYQGRRHFILPHFDEEDDVCDCYFKHGMDDDMGEVHHYCGK